MTDTITGADVERVRKLAAKDQAGFGRALGVSERTIRGWESGGTIPAAMGQLVRGAEAALLGGEALRHWGRHMAATLRQPGA